MNIFLSQTRRCALMALQIISCLLLVATLTSGRLSAQDLPACIDVFPGASTPGQQPPDVLTLPPFPDPNDGALVIGNNESRTLSGGEFFFSSISIGKNAELDIDGPVRIFVEGNVTIGNNVKIDSSAEELIILANGSITIGNNVEMEAILYSESDIEVGNNAEIKGAITARGNVGTKPNTDLEYDEDAVREGDFGGLCSNENFDPAKLPDHIRLLHSGTGLTCQPSGITVQACATTSCSALFDQEVTVSFTSPPGNWAPNPVTFTGQTTAGLQVTTPGLVTLNAAANPQADNATRCFTGGAETCQMEWFDSGFVIDVPDHVSDTVQPGTVAAVRSDDENQACAPGFSNKTPTVGFWSGYVNPGDGTLPVVVSGTLPVAVDGKAVSGSSPGTGIKLNFDAYGVAPIYVQYPDVGDMQLNARFEGSGDEAGLTMIGQKRFIVRPDTFTLDIPGNPGATNAGGPVFAVAAENFEINVQAWNASGNITPNFGRETPAESVALDNPLFAPVGANNPPLVGGFGPFGQDCSGNPADGGTACGAFSWPEVGIIEITPRLAGGAYLGSADVVGETSDPVGRFIPSHFNLSAGALTDRVDLDACSDEFTYIGELFGADWTLDARNAGGITTANYEGVYAKLGAAALGIGADEDISVDSSSIAWAGGFGTASASISADRGAPSGPYEDFQVGAAPVDVDGVELATFDVDLSSDGTNDHGLVGATELRFGRLAVDNAVGSELGPLTLPLRAEFFENETWKTNALDNCTAMALADHVALTSSNGDSGDGTMTVGVGSGSTSIQGADPVMLTDGTAGFTFSTPGSAGWVELSLLLDMDWHFLRDDLDDDGFFLEDPFARASFGLFEGNENRILLQEIPPK